jgi:hypothetical protein
MSGLINQDRINLKFYIIINIWEYIRRIIISRVITSQVTRIYNLINMKWSFVLCANIWQTFHFLCVSKHTFFINVSLLFFSCFLYTRTRLSNFHIITKVLAIIRRLSSDIVLVNFSRRNQTHWHTITKTPFAF